MTTGILLISENITVLDAAKTAFPNRIYHVPSGEDALEACTQTWDIILLDLDIPQINSLTLLENIKAQDPITEIIAISNYSDHCVQAMRLGAFTYLTLPIDHRLLTQTVDTITHQNNEFKTIIQLAEHAFVENIDDRILLLKELMSIRKLTGQVVTAEEFIAFFPPHQRGNPDTIQALKDGLGASQYDALKRSEPPIILVVEDEKNVRANLVEILNDYGFDTIEAKDGEEAIEIAALAPKIDLKLLDIGLPKKTGIEILPILNDLHPDSETIMLTAYKDNRDFIVSAFQNQAMDYMAKPYQPIDLLTKVSKALQRRCFKKIMPEIGQKILDKSLSLGFKFRILNDIADKRSAKKSALMMRDIYLFFPELEKSGLDASQKITDDIMSDGLSNFITKIACTIENGTDCRLI